MSRRSFCFLFGAGIAGAVVAPTLAESSTIRSADVLRIEANLSTKVVDSLGMPTVATFKSIDRTLKLGQSIAIDFQGQTFFSGRIAKTVMGVDGVEYTALEHLAFSDQQRQRPRSSPFAPLLVDGEGNPFR